MQGFQTLYEQVPDKFHMILKADNEGYKYLPGWRAIFGGIWIAGIYYFGANQYIIQKAFGAKSLAEAQKGMAFAGFLKLILPFVVVIPGIAVFALHADIAKPDEAYPWLLANIIPAGLKGLIFAALIAAIVSSFSAIINSASTIFTLDLYKPLIKVNASDSKLVAVGRISSIVMSFVAVLVGCSLGNLQQAFQFIQEYTGMVSPGITAIFILGLYWKKTTSAGALWGTIFSIPISIAIKLLFPEMPFLDQMLVVFFIVVTLIVLVSILGKQDSASKGLNLRKEMFHTRPVFNVMSVVIVSILATIYFIFW
jgi:SSS family solute:Na+ symporter